MSTEKPTDHAAEKDAEVVYPVGYINDDRQHVMISIRNPTLLQPDRKFVQVTITIGNAVVLRDSLNAFLDAHEKQAEG